MDKCKRCICIQCKKQFNIIPDKCKHSDCTWCKTERETITIACRVFDFRIKAQKSDKDA